jgi:hypothetical protein
MEAQQWTAILLLFLGSLSGARGQGIFFLGTLNLFSSISMRVYWPCVVQTLFSQMSYVNNIWFSVQPLSYILW